MDMIVLHKLLQDLYEQKILPSDAAESLSTLPYQNLGFAKIDQHPRRRWRLDVRARQGPPSG